MEYITFFIRYLKTQTFVAVLSYMYRYTSTPYRYSTRSADMVRYFQFVRHIVEIENYGLQQMVLLLAASVALLDFSEVTSPLDLPQKLDLVIALVAAVFSAPGMLMQS